MTDNLNQVRPLELSPGATEWLLAFADDEHMIGSRHASWIGLGPFLEEDLAFCSIAQDELGHAIGLYEFLTEDVDRFALLRDATEYRSAWLAELPCVEWEQALVRHWLYDRAEEFRWSSIAETAPPALVAFAQRALREERFHREHAEMYLSRIATGDAAGRTKIIGALTYLLPYAVGVWEAVAGEADALTSGLINADSASLALLWSEAVKADLMSWGFDVPWPDAIGGQGGRTARSAGFDDHLASLQEVINIDRTAIW